MSTLIPPHPRLKQRKGVQPSKTPPLVEGDRLTQPEFHRRYEAMPSKTHAELIGGIVYMPSLMRAPHGRWSRHISTLLGVYEAATPGVFGADNVTTILGPDSEPQPDLMLALEPWAGGQIRINEDQYLLGAPELIIEVAHSSKSIDLHAKKEDYRKAGVKEYLVVCVEEEEVRVFDLPNDREVSLAADGIYRSRIFPGLWLDSGAAIGCDLEKLLRTGQRGLKSKDHASFVKTMNAAMPKPGGRAKRK